MGFCVCVCVCVCLCLCLCVNVSSIKVNVQIEQCCVFYTCLLLSDELMHVVAFRASDLLMGDVS